MKKANSIGELGSKITLTRETDIGIILRCEATKKVVIFEGRRNAENALLKNGYKETLYDWRGSHWENHWEKSGTK